MRVRPTVVAAAAALVSGVLTASPAARAADEDVTEAWFAHFSGGVKSGWSRERRSRTVAGTAEGTTKVWISEIESVLVRGPGGDHLGTPMRFTSRFVEDESGRVVSYATSVEGVGPKPQTREGKVVGGSVEAVEDGKARKVPYPEGALGPAAIDRAVAASLKPGSSGEAVQFRPIDPASSGPLRWTVHGMTEPADVLGAHRWLVRVEKTDETGIPDVTFPDGRGGSFGGSTNFGMQSWLRTEELVARADAEPASLLTSRIVAPDRAIATAPRPARVVLRLARKGGPVGDLPDGPGQRALARGKDGSLEIELTSGEPAPGTAILPRRNRTDPVPPDLAKWLAATPLAETGHDRVRGMAEAATGELVNSLRTARMIELAVREYLQPAPANVNFATAAEAISSGKGDASEFAVLAVALARAAGLPARLVAGFAYWPAAEWPEDDRPRGAFAPHLWAEVLVAEGVWFPIDALRMDGTRPRESPDELAGHGGFGPTHVAVLRTDLAATRPFTEILQPVLAFLDGLSVEVVSDGAKQPAGK